MAAYKHLGSNIFIGLTTDTKPTAANTANGALAFEFATNYATFTLYINNQTTWLPATEFTETIKNKTLDSTNTVSSASSLPTVTVAKGGTGATTATAGFDALSPMTAVGDIIVGSTAGTRTRLAVGTANQALKVNSGGTTLDYGTLPVGGGGTGATTLTGILKGNGTSAFTAVTAPTGAIVGDTDTQTLTNKTLTTPVITSISNSGTITVPTGTLTLATLTGSETLTNKTLTSPIISTISNTGTVTLPTSTDTLVGKATTDVLTNKSIDAKTNTFSNVHIHPSVKRTGIYTGAGTGITTACSGTLQGNATNIVVGSGASSGITTTGGLKWTFTTGATINSICGLRFNGNKWMERSLSPLIESKLQLRNGITTERCFFGFLSSAIAPVSSADPLANLSGVGFWYDSAVDTEWMIVQNDGSASSDSTTIINVATVDQLAHTYAIQAVAASNKFQYSYDGGAFVDVSTKIPAANTQLGFAIYLECLAGSAARTVDIWWIWNMMDG